MDAVLFHNPGAGDGALSEDELLAALREAGVEPHYCSTRSDTFEEMLARPADLFVVAGGDGTVAKVLARLTDRSIPVAIVPLGTANNIAHALGIIHGTLDFSEALRLGDLRQCDVGLARWRSKTRRFVEAAGLGPIATTVVRKVADDLDGVARLREGRAQIASLLKEAEPLDAEIVLDGRTLPGGMLAIEIMNIGLAGPALPLAPAADPGDGLLDVVCVPTDRREDMLSWLESPLAAAPPVLAWQGRKVGLTWRGSALRIDDEMMSEAEDVETIAIEVEEEPVKVLVPPPEDVQERARAT